MTESSQSWFDFRNVYEFVNTIFFCNLLIFRYLIFFEMFTPWNMWPSFSYSLIYIFFHIQDTFKLVKAILVKWRLPKSIYHKVDLVLVTLTQIRVYLAFSNWFGTERDSSWFEIIRKRIFFRFQIAPCKMMQSFGCTKVSKKSLHSSCWLKFGIESLWLVENGMWSCWRFLDSFWTKRLLLH